MGLRIRRQRSLVELLERRQLLSTIYVDAGATSSTHDGTSWLTAFKNLESALAIATYSDQVDVAEGTYTPTPETDRTISFVPANGVSIYGGFAGPAALNPNTRDPAAYPTILSGDIGALGNNSDNSYHVIQADVVTLDGLTVTGGNENGNTPHGAGLFATGDVQINNCTFIDNVASGAGNDVVGSGAAGGAVYLAETNGGSITNSNFDGNSAMVGGAVAAFPTFGSNITFYDCAFVGNSASTGGAIYGNLGNKIINCTFVANSIGSSTVGISSGIVENSIIWGDSSPNDVYGQFYASYSDIDASYGNSSNISSDPQFVRNPSPGPDGMWGTADDDYGNLELQKNSPCIDAGNNADVPTGVMMDLAGNPRFVDMPTVTDTGSGTPPIVDMGAYELSPPSLQASAGGPYSVVAGKSITLSGSAITNVAGSLQYAWDFTGTGQFTDAAGAAPVFSAASLSAPATVPIELQVINADGQTSISSTTVNVVPAVIYVDAKAPGADNGSDWKDAYTSLTDALNAAAMGQTIEVAAGIYYPTAGTDRTATFTLKDGVELDGGYAGYGADDSDSQRQDSETTVLSGGIGDSNHEDNSYHVVTADGVKATAVLDGFTIEAGYADDSSGMGGGIDLDNASPTIINCFIQNNFSENGGGGIYDLGSSPVISNTEIENNSSNGGGVGIWNDNSSPDLTNDEIIGNHILSGSGDGGGMADYNGSAPMVNSSEFALNKAASGGAVYDSSSDSQFTGCRIVDNYATAPSGEGGGIFEQDSYSQFMNCTFTANSAKEFGGAISATVSSNITLTNCILWGDIQSSGSNEISFSSSEATITFSDIEGGYGETGNINADPKFAASPDAGADNVLGSEDDYFGDQRLLAGSPCIGTGQISSENTDMGYAPYSSNPLVANMQHTPAAVVQGKTIKFSVDPISESTSDPIKSVTFYIDSNGNHTLDSGDAIVGQAKKGKEGWTASIPTKNAVTGNVKFFAVATTESGTVSDKDTRNSQTVYIAPKDGVALGNLKVKKKNQLIRIANVSGKVKEYVLYVDTNEDGFLDVGDQEIYEGKGLGHRSEFSPTPGMTYLFFAQAEGDDNRWSNVLSISATAPT